MSLYQDLESRGLIKQVTSPHLAKKLASESMTLYCGFDPTADSLHVGSLLQLCTLKRFHQAGHKIIAVVGGATGMIGDPSGKSQERSLQTQDQLNINQAGITEVINRLLGKDSKITVVNNYDWFKNLNFIEFLRDTGKHFTVNHMMAKESVRARLEDREHGISYTEFSYMLLQAYDYYHLHQKYGCNLQVGGSDQWGNITAGIELIRRMHAHLHHQKVEENLEHAFGITSPLVQKSDGSKFGKTESGTVWLSANRTSPYELYQFFIQTTDADAAVFLKYFTFLPLDEIKRLEATIKTAPEKREAQKTLAEEVVKMVHGDGALQKATQATDALFSEDICKLSEQELKDLFSGAPSLDKSKSTLSGEGIALIDLLAESGLCASKGAARKDLQGGGIYLNNIRMSDVNCRVTSKDLIASYALVLRKGKKNYHLVRFS